MYLGCTFKPRRALEEAMAEDGDDADIKELDYVVIATGFTQSFGFLPDAKYRTHSHLERSRCLLLIPLGW